MMLPGAFIACRTYPLSDFRNFSCCAGCTWYLSNRTVLWLTGSVNRRAERLAIISVCIAVDFVQQKWKGIGYERNKLRDSWYHKIDSGAAIRIMIDAISRLIF